MFACLIFPLIISDEPSETEDKEKENERFKDKEMTNRSLFFFFIFCFYVVSLASKSGELSFSFPWTSFQSLIGSEKIPWEGEFTDEAKEYLFSFSRFYPLLIAKTCSRPLVAGNQHVFEKWEVVFRSEGKINTSLETWTTAAIINWKEKKTN